MFASTVLARRIEGAEAAMMAEFGACLRARGADAVVEPIDGGIALLARRDSPMNKAIGFGFDGVVDVEVLARIESRWRQGGTALQCEVATLARCEVLQQLAGRGYRLVAFENVLGIDPARAKLPPSPFPVAALTADEEAAWMDAIVDAFLQGDGSGAGTADAFQRDALVAAMRDAGALPGMRRCLVRVDGAIAGGASMRLDTSGIAQLCGAATVPRFRRRGVQSALLRARLQHAAQAGCDVAVITTQPGSRSQQNAEREGFALLYARAILVLPA